MRLMEFCEAPVMREAIKSPPLSTRELKENPCFTLCHSSCGLPPRGESFDANATQDKRRLRMKEIS